MQTLNLNGSGVPLRPRPELATAMTGAGPGGRAQPVATQHDAATLRRFAHRAIELDRLEDARLVLERALEQSPDDLEVIGDLAALALRRGEAELALTLSERNLAIDPSRASSRFTLAFALKALGRTDEARVSLQVLMNGPGAEALRREGAALHALAEAELERLSALFPPEAAPPQPASAEVFRLPVAARFDLLVKLLYVLHRRQQLPAWVTVDVPTLYRRHIQLRSGGVDAEDPLGKPNVDAYVAGFDSLIDAMAREGYDTTQPISLSATDGLPVDGAHRMAAALAMDLPAALQLVDAAGQRWDLPWFQRHGVDPEACNVLLRTWARLRGDRACVSLLWAPAEAHWEALEAGLGEQMVGIGARTIELPREGYEELLRDIYAHDQGPIVGPAIEQKIRLLRSYPPRLRVVYTERREGDDAGAVEALKHGLRERFDASVPASWFVTLHTSSSPGEVRHLLDVVASEHNLAMLRRRRALPAAFLQRLADLRQALEHHGIAADEACVVGGGVLAALGLRDAAEIDVTIRRERRESRFDAGAGRLAPGIGLVAENYARCHDGELPPEDDALIASPDLHFQVRGLRFAAARIVRDRKQHQRREADLRDLPLLAAFADPRGLPPATLAHPLAAAPALRAAARPPAAGPASLAQAAGTAPAARPAAADRIEPVSATDFDALLLRREHDAACSAWRSAPTDRGTDPDHARRGLRLLQAQLESTRRTLDTVLERDPLGLALELGTLRTLDPDGYEACRTALLPLVDPARRPALALVLEQLYPQRGADQELLIGLLARLDSGPLARLLRVPGLSRNVALLEATTRRLLSGPPDALAGRIGFNLLALGSAALPPALHDAVVLRLRESGEAPAPGPALADPEAAARHVAARTCLPPEASARAIEPLIRPLRIALCVSGQLRGAERAIETWGALGLAGHDVDIYVHTWRERGHRLPDPQLLSTVPRRFDDDAFSAAYLKAGQRHGLETLQRRYPRLFDALGCGHGRPLDPEVDDATLRALYGSAATVVIEDGRDPAFAGWSAQDRMLYKLHAAHRLAATAGIDYDLMLRIRPDKPLETSGTAPDWNRLHAQAVAGRLIYSDAPPALREDLVIGDQFAAGTPESMAAYADTWKLGRRVRDEAWQGFPERSTRHASLAYSCLYQGLRVEAVPGLRFSPPAESLRLDRDQIRALLAEDLPEGPQNDCDWLLWHALA